MTTLSLSTDATRGAACRRVALLHLAAGLFLLGCRDDTDSPTAPPSEMAVALSVAPAFTQVSAGGAVTCGITAAGRAYCWGRNVDGEVGDGTVETRLTPVPVAGGLAFRQISAGNGYACGVTTDDRAYCWGRNTFGQLGVGTLTPHRTPIAVAGGRRFRTVAAGTFQTCALAASDRHGYCWGNNDRGQLGDGTKIDRLSPVAVSGGRAWQQISPGGFSTCGTTTAQQAYCWGADFAGQIGDGPERAGRVKPALVAGGHLFTQIEVGISHACAVTSDHRAYCWGEGLNGAIGDGKTLDRYTPRAVVGGLTIDRVTTGASYTCAETSANRAYCWGSNVSGQLGNGSTGQDALRPTQVVGGHSFAQVSAGDLHACGRTGANVTWCWGSNREGELGNGTTEDRSEPTLVIGPT